MKIRQLKFIRFVDETPGGQVAVANMLGYANPTYVSQMYTGRRSIGEKSARKIELAIGKPRYWLDTPDENLNKINLKENASYYGGNAPGHFDITDDEYALIKQFRKLSAEQQNFIRVSINGVIRNNNRGTKSAKQA